MLNSTMRIQGQSFLESATRQILEAQGIEIIKTKKQLEDLISIIQYITEGNRYLVSSVNIENMINNLPIDMNKISYFMYYSLSLDTIRDGNTFREDIDRSMKKLIKVVSQEEQRKIVIEKLKEETQSKKEENQQPQQESKTKEEVVDNQNVNQPEVDENGMRKIIDYINVPKEKINEDLKKNNPELYNILHDDETSNIFGDIFKEEDNNTSQQQEDKSTIEKIKEIISSEIAIDENSSYMEKFNYLLDRVVKYTKMFEDSSNYLDNERYKNMFILLFNNIIEEDMNLDNLHTNKDILSYISNHIITNTNKDNIDSIIKLLSTYEQLILNLVQMMEKENSIA